MRGPSPSGNNIPDSENNLTERGILEGLGVYDTFDEEMAELLQAVDNTKFIPDLRIVPYARQRNPGGKKTGIQILKELGVEYNIKPNYTFDIVENAEEADGPLEFKVTVFAGLRDGTGVGATRKEAMNEAAENCIRSIKHFHPSFDVNTDFKKFTKTEADKDILYVLSRMCKDFDLPDPEYESIVDERGLITFTCLVGNYAMEGRGKKKRTSQRKAAVNMYEFIREVYNLDRTDELLPF